VQFHLKYNKTDLDFLWITSQKITIDQNMYSNTTDTNWNWSINLVWSDTSWLSLPDLNDFVILKFKEKWTNISTSLNFENSIVSDISWIEKSSYFGPANIQIKQEEKITFSNSWEINSSGAINFDIYNDRGYDINVKWIYFWVHKNFDLSNVALENIEIWTSSWLTCSWSLISSIDYDVNMKYCELNNQANLWVWEKIAFSISGVINPSEVGNYPIWFRLQTLNNQEYFYYNTNIKDSQDNTPPDLITNLKPKSATELVWDLTEKISQNNTAWTATSSTWWIIVDITENLTNTKLITYSSYTDYNNPKKFFVHTDNQIIWKTYNYIITWIKDFNWNTKTITWSFNWYNPISPKINSVSSNKLIRWKTTNITVYGQNLFASAGSISLESMSGITLNWSINLSNKSNEYISFDLTTSSNANLWSRDLVLNIWWTSYTLYNAFYVEKDYENIVNILWKNTYFTSTNSWTLEIEFSSTWSSIWELIIQNKYWTSSLIPTINSQNFNWKILNLQLSWIEPKNFYELSFSGINFSWKEVDENMKVWFDFIENNNISIIEKIYPPILISSKPTNNLIDVPTQITWNSGFVIELNFDQKLQESTILTSWDNQNIKLKKSSDNSIIPFSEVNYVYLDWSYSKITLKTSTPLDYATSYYIELNWTILSDKWIWLVWNMSASEWNGTKIYFSTLKQTVLDEQFFIEKTVPYNWDLNFSSSGKLQLSFNNPIDKTTIDWNIKLYKVWITSNEEIPVSFSYDNEMLSKIIYISPNISLISWSKYRLSVSKNIKSQKQTLLSKDYNLDFKTINQLKPLNISWDYAKTDLSRIELWFSKDIKQDTISKDSIILLDSNMNKLDINILYDDINKFITIIPNIKLKNASYNLVITPNLKDIDNQSISTSSLYTGFSYSNSIYSKTYNASIVDNPLTVSDFFATSLKTEIKFNRNISDPFNKNNLIISYCKEFNWTDPSSCSNFTVIDPTDLIFWYDENLYKLWINWFSWITSISWQTILKVELNDSIKDMFDVSLTWNKTFYIPIFSTEIASSIETENISISQKAYVNPLNNLATKESKYFIDFPTTKLLWSGSTVEIIFPKEFDLTSANLDNTSYANYVWWDKTKPKFILSKDTIKNALIYTITSAYWAKLLNNNDFIVSDIIWILNPSQARDFTTDWYRANITTRNTSWLVLNKFISEPIYINPLPKTDESKILTINLKTLTWALNMSGVSIKLNWANGLNELYTNSSWQVTYTWKLNNKYSIFVDSTIKILSWSTQIEWDYISQWKIYDILLDDDKTLDINLTNINDPSLMMSLTWSILWLASWDEITLWINSKKWYFERKLLINSWNFIYDIKLHKNLWFVTYGIKPTVKKDYEWSFTSIVDWQEPKSKQIDIKSNNIWWQDFVIEKANNEFSITVKDDLGKNIPNASVYVYTPSGNYKAMKWFTDASWNIKFKLKKWIYTYWALVSWLGNSPDKTITIDWNISKEIIFILPERKVSWKVIISNNLWSSIVSNASIFAYNKSKWKYINTISNTSWNYDLYLSDWIWEIGWYINWYWNIDKENIILSGSNLENKNLILATDDLYELTWSINIDNSTWTWISQVNIYAESIDWNKNNNKSIFSDNNWTFKLLLKNWSYKLWFYSKEYWNIWSTWSIIMSWANKSIWSFVVATPKNLSISFTGSWMPENDNLSKFEWLIDIYDKQNNKWFNKKFNWITNYDFDNILPWDYSLKVSVTWIWEVYNSWLLNISSDKSININLLQKNIKLTGNIFESGSNLTLGDSFIEIKDILTKKTMWIKASWSWAFELNIKPSKYTYVVKKPDYETSKFFDLDLSNYTWTTYTLNEWIFLKKVENTSNLNIKINSSSWISLLNQAFINIKWLNEDNSENTLWFWKNYESLSWVSLLLPKYKKYKIVIKADWHKEQSEIITINNDISKTYTLDYEWNTIQPVLVPITPQAWWILSDEETWIKLILPPWSLWDGINPWTIISKETNSFPEVSWWEPIWWKVNEITAIDSNFNPINNLKSDINIELSYTWWELISTNTGITIYEVKNMNISYFDTTANSWISLPTTLSYSWFDLSTYMTGSDLLSTVIWDNYFEITLKSITDHLTLFTALVSSAVTNSTTTPPTTTPTNNTPVNNSSWWWWWWWWWPTTSIISWILSTKDKISTYLWNTTQSIKMLAWKNINDVLYIERNGKKLLLNDILSDVTKNVSNISSNLVAFWVWDIISTTKEWSLQIALDWYTRIDLAPESKMKISEVSNNFLTYENISWKIKYDFTNKTDTNFTYKVKWKTSYATIRWTTLEVETIWNKDVYNLIVWKIDVYNDKTNKSISMLAWDKLIIYNDWKEDLSWIKTNNISTEVIKTNEVNETNEEKINESNEEKIIIDKDLIWKKDELWNTINFLYSDVSENSWYFKYVNWLNSKWIIANNANFYPSNNITRIELLKMVSLSAWIKWEFDEKYTYDDIKDISYWWTKYVCSANKLWYISKENKLFRPSDNISRAEALKLIMSFKKIKTEYNSSYTFSDIKQDEWWSKYISTAAKMEYISSQNDKFNPKNPITRAEVVKMVYNIFYN